MGIKLIQRIYLTGFMTSGKTTLGKILANIVGWDFVDIDSEIEKTQMESVTYIIEKRGIAEFRKLEKDEILRATQKEKVVVSLGGGALIDGDNLEVVKNSGILIYLKLSPAVLYERLKNKINRPLFQNGEGHPLPKNEAINKIKTLLSEREPGYLAADIIINFDKLSINSGVEELRKRISKIMRTEI
ncbi:MAG: shikimate kinase [Ignavibacteriaceae bacterium]|nr:shikimate kinase [Ignavibacteriaceae bacterium]